MRNAAIPQATRITTRRGDLEITRVDRVILFQEPCGDPTLEGASLQERAEQLRGRVLAWATAHPAIASSASCFRFYLCDGTEL